MKLKLLCCAALSATMLAAGCSGTGIYERLTDGQKDARKTYRQLMRSDNLGASYADTPAAASTVITIERKADWLSANVAGRTTGNIPMQILLDDILRGSNIKLLWGGDVDPLQPVAGYLPDSTLGDALDWISSRTGYAYSIDDQRRSVTWTAMITKSFNISYLGGSYDYQIGSTSGGAGGGGGDASGSGGSGSNGPVGSFAAKETSYSSVSGEGMDIFKEIEEAVDDLIGESGTVSVSRVAGSAVVTASPVAMGRVENYFKGIEQILAQQIMLEVKIVRFTGDEANRRGIDWNLIRDSGNDIVNFIGASPGAAGLGVAPAIINYTAEQGSSGFIQLLDEFGDISIVTEPRVVTQANRVVELELGNITGYLGESEVTSVSSNTNILPAVDLEAAYVEDGYFLFALAKVGHGGNIVLHLASRFQDLLEIVRKEAGASAIETPSVARSRFVQTVVMRNGSTLVLNALRQEINETGAISPLNARDGATSRNARRKIVETLVLVTPVIVDMG